MQPSGVSRLRPIDRRAAASPWKRSSPASLGRRSHGDDTQASRAPLSWHPLPGTTERPSTYIRARTSETDQLAVVAVGLRPPAATVAHVVAGVVSRRVTAATKLLPGNSRTTVTRPVRPAMRSVAV